MKLYHGSTVEISHVDLAKSKPNKDFGRAFYLSEDKHQALEMAQFRAEFEDAVFLWSRLSMQSIPLVCLRN